MTVVVVRGVSDRYRGFLVSVMPEVTAGLFVSPDLARSVRERLWAVVSGWWNGTPGGSVVLIFRDDNVSGRLGLLTLG